jgi:hypothetical protein
MSLNPAFLKDFWTYLSGLEWWQGLFIIIAIGIMLLIKGSGKKIVEKFKEQMKPKKLKCEVCIKMVLMKSIIAQTKMFYLSNSIIEDQKNIAIQKISEIKSLLLKTYIEETNIIKSKDNIILESIQYKAYLGLVNDALYLVKEELERCFRENGFHEKSGLEFSLYVKDKTKNLVFIIQQHLKNLYPTVGMAVPIEKEIDNIEKNFHYIQDIIFEIFEDAKSIKKTAENKLKECDIELIKFINKDLNIPLSDTSRISIEDYRTSV